MKIVYSEFDSDAVTKMMDDILDYRDTLCNELILKGVSADIKTTPDMMSELVDWFGTDFKIVEKDSDHIVVRIKVNSSALRFRALQYGPFAEVLGPKMLREQLKEDIAGMYRRYQ